VIESRQQLPSGQIAGRAQNHEDMRFYGLIALLIHCVFIFR
jgi:hypothetical protein